MKKTLLTVTAAALTLAACQSNKNTESTGDVIGKPNVAVENGRFTPEVMWSLGVMSEYAVSPDGQNIVYTLRYTDMEQNKNNTELYLMPVAGGEAQRLTYTAESEFCPVWKDNNTLLFCRGNEIRSIDIKSLNESVIATCERGFEG